MPRLNLSGFKAFSIAMSLQIFQHTYTQKSSAKPVAYKKKLYDYRNQPTNAQTCTRCMGHTIIMPYEHFMLSLVRPVT